MIDFPRTPLRVALIGNMISLCVLTGWLVLADTHIAVVLQFAVMAVYVLTVANGLFSVVEISVILGRGFVSLGTLGLLCGGLIILHTDLVLSASIGWPQGPIIFGGAILISVGLCILRPIAVLITDYDVDMARTWADFTAYHRENLAAPLAEMEVIRRKTERNYWILTAVGVPVSAGMGLVLIVTNLASRPPEWLFFLSAVAILLCSVGVAKFRWLPSPVQTEEFLRLMGNFVGLQYSFGGSVEPDKNTMTVFEASRHALELFILPSYRELKIGASFRGSRNTLQFVFFEFTTVPPRKLGQNTARMARNFQLLVVENPTDSGFRTICHEDRGPFGHRGMQPNLVISENPNNAEGNHSANMSALLLSKPDTGHVSGDELGIVNDQFTKNFVIYTEDHCSARQQLSENLMMAVIEFWKGTPAGETLRFAFSEGYFFATIEASKSWLEIDPPRAMSLEDPQFSIGYLERLQKVLNIAGGLGSNSD